MKYDSVLNQQSISGKIVSLILCVWKPCYMKSGHKCHVYIARHSRWPCKLLFRAVNDSEEWPLHAIHTVYVKIIVHPV